MSDELASDPPPTDMIQNLSFRFNLKMNRVNQKAGDCNARIASREDRQPETKKQL